jgi:hypothetical protein
VSGPDASAAVGPAEAEAVAIIEAAGEAAVATFYVITVASHEVL